MKLPEIKPERYDSGLDPETFELENEKARAVGYDVLIADSTTLYLDIDTEDEWNHAQSFLSHSSRFVQLFGVRYWNWWESKSGLPHRHVCVRLKEPLDALTRIALQAILGSDLIREMLNLKRFANGVEEPSRLFAPKERPTNVPR